MSHDSYESRPAISLPRLDNVGFEYGLFVAASYDGCSTAGRRSLTRKLAGSWVVFCPFSKASRSRFLYSSFTLEAGL